MVSSVWAMVCGEFGSIGGFSRWGDPHDAACGSAGRSAALCGCGPGLAAGSARRRCHAGSQDPSTCGAGQSGRWLRTAREPRARRPWRHSPHAGAPQPLRAERGKVKRTNASQLFPQTPSRSLLRARMQREGPVTRSYSLFATHYPTSGRPASSASPMPRRNSSGVTGLNRATTRMCVGSKVARECWTSDSHARRKSVTLPGDRSASAPGCRAQAHGRATLVIFCGIRLTPQIGTGRVKRVLAVFLPPEAGELSSRCLCVALASLAACNAACGGLSPSAYQRADTCPIRSDLLLPDSVRADARSLPAVAGPVDPHFVGSARSQPTCTPELAFFLRFDPVSGAQLALSPHTRLPDTRDERPPIELPPPPSGATLTLSGLLMLGGLQLARAARNGHIRRPDFGSLPDWYHADAVPVGHSIPFEFQPALQPIPSYCWAPWEDLRLTPTSAKCTTDDDIDCLFPSRRILSLTAPRGPPSDRRPPP